MHDRQVKICCHGFVTCCFLSFPFFLVDNLLFPSLASNKFSPWYEDQPLDFLPHRKYTRPMRCPRDNLLDKK
jgi:hypothetical protein